MENIHIGLREIIEGGGVLGIAVWFVIKHGKKMVDTLLPFLKTWQKNKSEHAKLKLEMSSTSNTEIISMLKEQIEELKQEQKAKDVRHQQEKEEFQKRIMELEVTLATLRERYRENGLHSRGSKKKNG